MGRLSAQPFGAQYDGGYRNLTILMTARRSVIVQMDGFFLHLSEEFSRGRRYFDGSSFCVAGRVWRRAVISGRLR
jgi:hypothetical protein